MKYAQQDDKKNCIHAHVATHTHSAFQNLRGNICYNKRRQIMAGEVYISEFISDIFPLIQKHSASQFIRAVISCLWLTSLFLFLMTLLIL